MVDARRPDGMAPGAGPLPLDAHDGSRDARGGRRGPVPRSFQARLTFAFVGVVALTLGLIAPIVILRLDEYFRVQEEQRLSIRAADTAATLDKFINLTVGNAPVVAYKDGKLTLNSKVRSLLVDEGLLALTANRLARANIELQFGTAYQDTDGTMVVDPEPDLAFDAQLDTQPAVGQARDPAISAQRSDIARVNRVQDWGLAVTLSNPYTSRASTLAAITGLLLVMALVSFLVAMMVAAFVTRRFTTPLTRLTEASRRLAEGDFSSRVPADELATGTLELRELSLQFNSMADRLQESVSIIRRDRDYSRDFLADVSHELRTPIAAIRTFTELLQGPAGRDPAARMEFLDASAVQLDRLDWLAQNLLELSKLDSGLVLLDLRPDDVRGTIESAVEQQLAAADRRGIRVIVDLPDRPLRIRHDPPRIGQVITNLVGNALKFTPRGGSVTITARHEPGGGARIEIVDTGVGIHESELPLIFDRFYRGAEANEARSTGSGLGLSIVKSIVDMHHGTIAVESRVGNGSRFVVTLPSDPREVDVRMGGAPGYGEDEAAQARPEGGLAERPRGALPSRPESEGQAGKVNDSSPSQEPAVNVDRAPLVSTRARPVIPSRSEQGEPSSRP
jgi:signal transduction histidine kinase